MVLLPFTLMMLPVTFDIKVQTPARPHGLPKNHRLPPYRPKVVGRTWQVALRATIHF